MKKLPVFLLFISFLAESRSENGYELWLRYQKINNPALLAQYKKQLSSATVLGSSPTNFVSRNELTNALRGLTGSNFKIDSVMGSAYTFIAGTVSSSPVFDAVVTKEELKKISEEGFIIKAKPGKTYITGHSEMAVLYGIFHYLRLLQTHQSVNNLNIISSPKLKLRMLNHWDNLNRTVERGYAGFSIWDWHKLPGFIDQRYIDYARANASIGINAVSLTNVNANAVILTAPYIQKVKALADLLRPYGIKVFLTARFSAPMEIGQFKTADPLNQEVQNWWNKKTSEIYELIPDFGGFLVKANSEGQPGPQDYKRTHADGANMLAKAVAPHNGIVIWRAFVYAAENPVDRHKQAYDDFVKLDGKFADNVMVQVKNGAIDFMPREPFHPLFGSMPKTPLMMEFQVTQEYLGQATNWIYLTPLFKEVLDSDTYSKGKGSTVAKVIDGSLDDHRLNGMTGVANIGTDINWCGHPMAQANWYSLGRLAWDYSLTSEAIADEWLRMTFNNDGSFLASMKQVMLRSREIMVDYMNPVGLHHIMNTGHHYGPAPWVNNLSRPEWNPVYYHKADSNGIGFDRTVSGSNAIVQYFPEAVKQWEKMETCDEKYLLWFHHVPWSHKMKTGRTLWDELCYKYNSGSDSVKWMKTEWMKQVSKVDPQRHRDVSMLLDIQLEESIWWRNACLLYFQTFSKMPIPPVYEKPNQSLDYYKNLRFPFAPGN
jgi:alpha-glucuronidase